MFGVDAQDHLLAQRHYGLLQMLGSYVKFLMMLFGPRCDHLAQVSAMCFCLLGRVAMFQKMTKEQVGHLL